ncbi:hypothetical protein B0H11DRAFT_2290181 [Mycena galericulata]|nr:hypothetical protein B0H11DRAFT_2290181 [Mycena galericulata]
MKIHALLSGPIPGTLASRNPDGLSDVYAMYHQLIARASTNFGSAPIIVGTIFGVVVFILLVCLIWFFARRRQETQDKERSVDLRSRPFPLDVKFGRSGSQPIHRTVSEPARALPVNSVPNSISLPPPSRTPRRPPPPRLRLSMPMVQNSKEGEGLRKQRSSISKSVLAGRWNTPLPPVSQGYGVGLMTREVTNAREPVHRQRSSISKAFLGSRWRAHLPPISQGYGVGLMTREVRNLSEL